MWLCCVNEGPYECSPIYHKPTFYIWNQEVKVKSLVQNQLHPLFIKAVKHTDLKSAQEAAVQSMCPTAVNSQQSFILQTY